MVYNSHLFPQIVRRMKRLNRLKNFRMKRLKILKNFKAFKKQKTSKITLNDMPNEVLIKIFQETFKNHDTIFCLWKSDFTKLLKLREVNHKWDKLILIAIVYVIKYEFKSGDLCLHLKNYTKNHEYPLILYGYDIRNKFLTFTTKQSISTECNDIINIIIIHKCYEKDIIKTGKSNLARKLFDDYKYDGKIIFGTCTISIVEFLIKMKLLFK
ncbi:hypothetical protein C1645_821297 [Glomus cerebriforme]|uniref:F-box domain-containing protein n=1 Tax=Glomus cerebriforme TaxID=658196 RepID=A0A397T0E3_9GLOM|nr:hypothetical protein C1645_821297 [Glomus cerebriforme]